ncbi:hypothetical protein DFH07DRAFT_793474 [Mycena maculata]|uniref:Uncharacterized protein n=1 Tax=Mycena maculata TaxID=230809 RepID=A0AAD7K928_9AGAR|nr:hypothetical protein DFH07DRAFT_793474 [Mycena maculata]
MAEELLHPQLFTSLFVLAMGSAGALIPYSNPTTSGTGIGDRRNPDGWAIFLNPTPGRTLDEFYSATGQALATRANRMAHRLGLGPDVVARQITEFFGTGEDREQRLTSLGNKIPVKLKTDCSRLMEYALPIGQDSAAGLQEDCRSHYALPWLAASLPWCEMHARRANFKGRHFYALGSFEF